MAIMIPNRITAEMRATSGEAKTFNVNDIKIRIGTIIFLFIRKF